MTSERKSISENRKYYIEMLFKIIGAVGVVSGVVYGALTLTNSNEKEPYVTYYSKAELLSVKLESQTSTKFKIIQFELNGTESGFVKDSGPFAGVGTTNYTTYSLDPYYGNSSKGKSSNPVFNVSIQNTSDKQVVLTKVVYRVKKVGQVRGGDYGPLSPNVKYRHGIMWKTGDQLASLSPPFSISANRAGSFLLEIESLDKGVGLAWLLEIIFIDSDNKSVSTKTMQLLMSKKHG